MMTHHQQATHIDGKFVTLFNVAVLKESGLPRVINGQVGMTFPVDRIVFRADNTYLVHVRDYRYPTSGIQFAGSTEDGWQFWTLDGKDVELL